MQIELTQGEAQALADLMDRECARVPGLQTAMLWAPIGRRVVEAAQAEQAAVEADDN